MNKGESTRLFILATLQRFGSLHGHGIRREAQTDKAELWSDVRIGSIYSAIRKLEQEGLIKAKKNEREGAYPERTLYTLTDDGKQELAILQTALLRKIITFKDPFDLAFSLSYDVSEDSLRHIVEDRIALKKAFSVRIKHQREMAKPHLTIRDELLFDHLLMRLKTDIEWYQQVLQSVGLLHTD